MPTTPILILRFPDGDVEYRSTRGELPIGVTVRARGALWRVSKHRNGAAILEAAEPAGGAGALDGPAVIPTGLGDDPLIVEVLAEA